MGKTNRVFRCEQKKNYQTEPYTRRYPAIITTNHGGYCEIQCLATNLKGSSKTYDISFREMAGRIAVGTYGYITMYCYPHPKVKPTYVYYYDFTESSKEQLEELFGKAYDRMVENQFDDNLWSMGYM